MKAFLKSPIDGMICLRQKNGKVRIFKNTCVFAVRLNIGVAKDSRIEECNKYAEKQRILGVGRGRATSGREIGTGVRGSTKHPIGLQSAIGVFKIGSGFPCTPLYIAWKPGNFGFTRLSP